jgi:hypothetical protein
MIFPFFSRTRYSWILNVTIGGYIPNWLVDRTMVQCVEDYLSDLKRHLADLDEK